MELLLITIAVMGGAMLIMAIGIIFKRKALRGSCGGSDIWDCDGDDLACGACPNRPKRKAAMAEHPGKRLRDLAGTRQ